VDAVVYVTSRFGYLVASVLVLLSVLIVQLAVLAVIRVELIRAGGRESRGRRCGGMRDWSLVDFTDERFLFARLVRMMKLLTLSAYVRCVFVAVLQIFTTPILAREEVARVTSSAKEKIRFTSL